MGLQWKQELFPGVESWQETHIEVGKLKGNTAEVAVGFGHAEAVGPVVCARVDCRSLSGFEEVISHVMTGLVERATWKRTVDSLQEPGAAPADSQ